MDDTKATLHYKEADWIALEKLEHVKLIQHYKLLYFTALFGGIVWLLQTTILHPENTWSQRRATIAPLLCLLPFVNALFMAMLFEINAQMRSLARYLFILGYEFDGSTPAWRWERWRNTSEGSTRTFNNVLYRVLACCPVPFVIAAWALQRPTLESRGYLILWLLAAITTIGTIGAVARITQAHRHQTPVADARRISWSALDTNGRPPTLMPWRHVVARTCQQVRFSNGLQILAEAPPSRVPSRRSPSF